VEEIWVVLGRSGYEYEYGDWEESGYEYEYVCVG
jgi:hypothetical protein